MHKNFKDLSNQKFGKLLAIKNVGKSNGKYIWECLCDCGQTKNIVSSKLISREIKSCGCLLHNKGKISAKYRGCGDLSGYQWGKIVNSAKEQAWQLLQSQNFQCALSGVPIVICDTRYGNCTASLDRIDSKKGYEQGNIQWVHKHINKIKQDFDEIEFIKLCSQVFAKNFHKIQDKEIINWIDYFLLLAFVISIRSKDAQTQHGCVITDREHHIIGTGYNSFTKGIPDSIMPNLRDEKYIHMIHSEKNALLNCKYSPQNVPGGAIAYVTGKPCLSCLQHMINGNITTIYAANRQGSVLEGSEQKDFDFLIQASNIQYEIIQPDFNQILCLVSLFNQNSFI